MIKKMLMSLKTIIYLIVCCVVVVFDYWLLKVMLKKLREFEQDAIKYDQKIKDKAKRENRQVRQDDLVFPDEKP